MGLVDITDLASTPRPITPDKNLLPDKVTYAPEKNFTDCDSGRVRGQKGL